MAPWDVEQADLRMGLERGEIMKAVCGKSGDKTQRATTPIKRKAFFRARGGSRGVGNLSKEIQAQRRRSQILNRDMEDSGLERKKGVKIL